MFIIKTKKNKQINKHENIQKFIGHKIPKAYLESVSGKRTDNSMATKYQRHI
jgi:hypothetical protein